MAKERGSVPSQYLHNAKLVPLPPIFFITLTTALALKFVKWLRHVPYETALQRLRLFSLVRRRIRGYLIYTYKIMRGLLDFPCDAVFAAPHPH